ncbi:MAG: DNA repair protein RecN [Christensenellaceae bacterium]|nr:DNA repair protein RecN [Christensenellaceae bacterium]
MLERLIIQNIALIEQLDIELSEGFNVLTGETGAGKSIIIDSVGLVLGERASKELISTGKQKARVEAFFGIEEDSQIHGFLNDLGIDCEDDTIIIVREITASGKSICRINGEIVPLATLKMITDQLVDIHGQHAHQSLLAPQKHIGMVDAYRSNEILPVRKRVGELYRQYNEVVKKLNSGFMSEAERERRLDILSYQINEIEKAKLSVGEESEIKGELTLLSNAEQISSALEQSGELVSGDSGALDKLRRAVNALSRISELSPQYGEIFSRLDSTYYEIEDAAYQLRDMRLGYEYSPERLNELENRLDYINSLKRKYGGSVEAVLDFMREAQAELEELTGSEEVRRKLFSERERLKNEYFIEADRLTKLRRASAEELSNNVMLQLHELGMSKARFSVMFSEPDGELHSNGNDALEFMLSANMGEPLKPLSKVASGGELSRIMLAIKTVCADADGIATLIFDEIDTGISGRTAVRVGERLIRVAKDHQVLSITHLPQIAAFADCHLLVEKHSDDDRTYTNLRELNASERRLELARIMGSVSTDEAAVKYADELIETAERFKADFDNKMNK